MKKTAASLLVTGSVPLLALFALVAAPARLYAETAPLPPACATTPEVEACSAKSSGEICLLDAGHGTCHSALCYNVDSGTNADSLVCFSTVGGPVASPDAISGSDADSDANSLDGSSDAGSVENPDAGPASPGAVDSGTSSVPAAHGEGGCSTAGSSSGALSSVASLLLAAFAIFRARRQVPKIQ
jgi:hypothetical protein